jgi:hypothetical protein
MIVSPLSPRRAHRKGLTTEHPERWQFDYSESIQF